MSKLKFILIKAFRIYLVLLTFVLSSIILIWLPTLINVIPLFAITIPLLLTIYITLIKIIDWEDLFDFDYYEL